MSVLMNDWPRWQSKTDVMNVMHVSYLYLHLCAFASLMRNATNEISLDSLSMGKLNVVIRCPTFGSSFNAIPALADFCIKPLTW